MQNDKLKILFVCQYGYPEPYPSLYHIEEIAKRSHNVLAVTGMPNYPMGDIYEGYDNKKINFEEHNGVKIAHVPIIPRKKNIICRFLNYISFSISAKKYLKSLDEEYDVVFVNQTSPINMVEPAIYYAKKHKKKIVMHCMDLWPACLCIGGIKENSVLYNYYFKKSKKIYNSVDLILVTSKMFKSYLMQQFNIDENKIDYLPQFAPDVFDSNIKREENDKFDFVFAGNIGKAQNLYVILKTAKMFLEAKNEKVLFHIVGDGQELDKLKKYANDYNITNVIFYGRKPIEEMPEFYKKADAMLVSMVDDKYVSLTLPAKIQSYMCAKKAIIGSAKGEIANIINDSACGLCAKANDEYDLYEKIVSFINSDITKFEENSKKYYDENFDKKKIIDKLENILLEYS